MDTILPLLKQFWVALEHRPVRRHRRLGLLAEPAAGNGRQCAHPVPGRGGERWPRKAERDAADRRRDTGHEWDGIRELDNPLPRWWLYTFYVSIVVRSSWWLLYPSWPWGYGYLPGLLGCNERLDFERRYAAARAAQAQWTDQIAALDAAAIQGDPELVQFAIAGGEKGFKTNCAPCHGLGGAGQGFFPTLADDDWIWGGAIDQIEYTIRHGIRNGVDPDARDNAMPAFGADGLLDKAQIADVTQYVLSLTQRQSDEEAAGARCRRSSPRTVPPATARQARAWSTWAARRSTT